MSNYYTYLICTCFFGGFNNIAYHGFVKNSVQYLWYITFHSGTLTCCQNNYL